MQLTNVLLALSFTPQYQSPRAAAAVCCAGVAPHQQQLPLRALAATRRTAIAPRCQEAAPLPSLRQRLKEVQVDWWLRDEVTAIVLHKKASLRHRRKLSPAEAAAVAEPLENPFGTKPKFVASASDVKSLPAEGLPEIAFIGRSNVGKSSLLNAMTGVSTLAKVSDKPGKTQALNFFELGRKEQAFLLVDMPGYGFAFAKESSVERWRELSAEYLRSRKSLKLVLVVIDAKIGLKASDLQMLAFLEDARVKYTLVLTKADAAGPPPRAAQLAAPRTHFNVSSGRKVSMSAPGIKLPSTSVMAASLCCGY